MGDVFRVGAPRCRKPSEARRTRGPSRATPWPVHPGTLHLCLGMFRAHLFPRSAVREKKAGLLDLAWTPLVSWPCLIYPHTWLSPSHTPHSLQPLGVTVFSSWLALPCLAGAVLALHPVPVRDFLWSCPPPSHCPCPAPCPSEGPPPPLPPVTVIVPLPVPVRVLWPRRALHFSLP